MKSILIIHDIGYSDVDKMMRNIDYVAQHSKTFDGEFTVYVEPESPLAPILEGSGLPFSTTDLPKEPDTLIVFSYDKDVSEYAHAVMIKQWQSRRPVYPFMVVKS